jgi:response regulator RpfG family c-di-GMP phosphodiesterase
MMIPVVPAFAGEIEGSIVAFQPRGPLTSAPEGRMPRLLIIDDERANVILLERVLAGFRLAPIAWTCDPTQAANLFLSVNPDLVILDLQMPGMNGFEVLAALQAAVAPQALPPVLVITGDASAATRNKALSGGAKDFIAKPFDPDEVRLRVSGRSEFMRQAEQVARYHHERWDGTGYPEGLRGTRIPLPARIVTIADVYDALVSDRPYRLAFTVEEATRDIEMGSGTRFDPTLVKIFLRGLRLSRLPEQDSQRAERTRSRVSAG